MMSHTGCENMLGGRSVGPNENISDERGALRKCAEGAGGMALSVWPVITPTSIDGGSDMGGARRPKNHFKTNCEQTDLVNQLDTGLRSKLSICY